MEAGLIVGGYLRLVSPLGQGGMGAVWVAEHQRLGGRVAVKFLSTEYVNDASTRARFEHEARVSAQVRSPHVVQVMDFGLTEAEPPQPYIVMELLEGEDLSKRLERDGPLLLSEAESILAQLCQALSYAHGIGVVHRDIKPENVFLVRGARTFVKLLDFGIALGTTDLTVQRLTQTGLIIGTAHYMSPEQLFSSKEVDYRTDLWAAGVLVYQMLTARLPFNGETFGALCVNVQSGHFQPVSELARVPDALNAWFKKALATVREERFQSADEMFRSFQAAAMIQEELPDTVYAPHASLGTESKAAMSLPAHGSPESEANLTLPKKSYAPLLGALVAIPALAAGVWWNASKPQTDVEAESPQATASNVAASLNEPTTQAASAPVLEAAPTSTSADAPAAPSAATTSATERLPLPVSPRIVDKPPQRAKAPKLRPAPPTTKSDPKVPDGVTPNPTPAKKKYRGF